MPKVLGIFFNLVEVRRGLWTSPCCFGWKIFQCDSDSGDCSRVLGQILHCICEGVVKQGIQRHLLVTNALDAKTSSDGNRQNDRSRSLSSLLNHEESITTAIPLSCENITRRGVSFRCLCLTGPAAVAASLLRNMRQGLRIGSSLPLRPLLQFFLQSYRKSFQNPFGLFCLSH